MSRSNPTHGQPWRTHHSHPAQPEVPPTAAAGVQIADERLYQGMPYDPAQAIYFESPRAFAPADRDWIHGDAAYVDGLDVYQFCADNPINRVEPV